MLGSRRIVASPLVLSIRPFLYASIQLRFPRVLPFPCVHGQQVDVVWSLTLGWGQGPDLWHDCCKVVLPTACVFGAVMIAATRPKDYWHNFSDVSCCTFSLVFAQTRQSIGKIPFVRESEGHSVSFVVISTQRTNGIFYNRLPGFPV